jgi:hypothetical protein
VKRIIDIFIIKGIYRAMDWILDLRIYRLKIYYNITVEGYMDWVGKEIRYKKIEFTIEQL